MNAKGTYSVKKWVEDTVVLLSSHSKITRATVEYELSGEIEGVASVEYIMYYDYFDPTDRHKASATYVGLLAFQGKLLGRSGNFVMKDDGTFRDGTADSTLVILEGSGTDSLKGIMGEGTYRANQEGYSIELHYDHV